MFILMRNGERTKFEDLTDVLRIAQADDPVYVATRGWMSVGDLRWNMMAGSANGQPSGDV